MASSRPIRSLKLMSRREEVRVTHIGNPRIFKANPSEFSAVVQSLTGQKKRKLPPISNSASKEVEVECRESSNSASKEVEVECRESCKSKEPRHESEFQFCSNLGITGTALLPHKANGNNNKYGVDDQQEYSNHMMSTLDWFDGKILPDFFSFDFMGSASDVV